MQAVERIEHRNASKNFWLHVAFQAVHGGAHRESTDSCDLLPAPPGKHPADDGAENASFGAISVQKRSFYQDRLGTNLWKTQKTWRFFRLPQRWVRLSAALAGPRGQEHHRRTEAGKNKNEKPVSPLFECINDHFTKTDSGQA